MGQYYLIVNPEAEEYIDPHNAGSGLKALEIASGNLNNVVQYLCTNSAGGGGSFNTSPDIRWFGHWVGDPVIWAGDYADDEEDYYHTAQEEFTDVTSEVVEEYNKAVPVDQMIVPMPWDEKVLELTSEEKEALAYNYAEWFSETYAEEAGVEVDPENISGEDFFDIVVNFWHEN